MTQRKIFVVAGEASGDLLGAGLCRKLKQHYGESLELSGIAGPQMQAEGCRSVYPMERLSIMGIVAILKRYRELSKKRKELIEQLKLTPPDCFIGIDAPEFNLDFELALKAFGIKTVHYVSPSVWAWRPKRIFKIKRAVDLMLALFTFEVPYYRKHQIDVECVGHPLADAIDMRVNVEEYREQLKLKVDSPVLAILPGSRSSELSHIVEPFIEAAKICLETFPDLQLVLPVINEQRKIQLESILSNVEDCPKIQIFVGNARQVMAASDAVLIASGTATLEAALLKKPMVVGYKMSRFSYAIFSRMLKIKNVSLPNLLADERLVKELIQEQCQPQLLANEVIELLHGGDRVNHMVERFTQIHTDLRKDADTIAANAVIELIEGKRHVNRRS
ncbi:lipid-A-disaccharide synthase [Pleionea litopenaei]|uniref:Lipid-A-disaccharide synthase n=1 Tax=Pleionea litopenaei TaxID=3070815 RepID=A0AA51RSV8_9GAMM|nr:lipid-A-disaccharide synthase [Pleionea sp. HL-JVS1]WMS86970.1 lipid-A-disaccharide synthase [Pleionea sp. HL-JVS1]